MANAMFDSGREGFLAGDLDWDADDFRAILIDTGEYTVDLANHDMLDDVASAARIQVSGSLTGKSTTAGVADCADITWSSVTGDTASAIIIYKHTGTDSTSTLVAWIDTADQLPISLNGSDIVFQVDSGANKLFKL